MRKIYSLYMALGMGALSCTSAQAQTQRNDSVVNRVVVIENEYTPEIMDASKVNTLPAIEAPVVKQQAAEYAVSATPYQGLTNETIQPIAINVEGPKTTNGYVRAGYGSYGNLDLLGNYLFNISPKDKLDAFVSLDGMNGKLNDVFVPDTKWKAHYYRTRAALDYRHQFNKMELQAAGKFGLTNFNTLPTSPNWGDYGDNQKFTSGSGLVGLKSTDNTLPVNFTSSAEVLINRRKHEVGYNESREGVFRLKGDVSSPIEGERELGYQLIGIGLELNSVNNHAESPGNGLIYDYSNVGEPSTGIEPFDSWVNFQNYTTVDLNPYYTLSGGNWRLRAGANVDLAFGFGKSFNISPDVLAQYTIANNYVGYIKATGGRTLNDFARLEQVNPYAMMITNQPYNTYEQINAGIGFKGSPVEGLWFHVGVAYQQLKDDLYTVMVPYTYLDNTYRYSTFLNTKTDNTSFTGEVKYNYKNVVKTGISATYYDWSADNTAALAFKPELEINWMLDINPIEKLNIGASYNYTKRCKSSDEIERTAAINSLNLNVSYNVYGGVSVYAQANNLLGSKYMWYDGYAAERLNFLGGLSFRF